MLNGGFEIYTFDKNYFDEINSKDKAYWIWFYMVRWIFEL